MTFMTIVDRVLGKASVMQNIYTTSTMVYIASELVSALGGMIDGVIIGCFLGAEQFAAFGIANPLLFVFAVFGSIYYSGSRTLCTKLVGEGRFEEARALFSTAFYFVLLISLLMMAGVMTFSGPITELLGAGSGASSLFEDANQYIRGIAVGLPAMNGAKYLSSYMQLDNDKKRVIISTYAMTVFDIAADLWVLKYMDGSLWGMGMATSLSYYLQFAILASHFFMKGACFTPVLHGLRPSVLWDITANGAAKGISRAAKTARISIMNNLLAGSAISIAAYGAMRSAHELLSCFMIAAGDATAVLAGIMLGEKNRMNVRDTLSIAIRRDFFFISIMAMLVFGFADTIARLFLGADPEALALGTQAIRCYAFGMPFYCLGEIYQGYLMALGRKKLAIFEGFVINAGAELVAVVPFFMVLGPEAVWISNPIGMLLIGVFILAMVYVSSRKEEIRGDWLDVMTMLPKDFGVKKENLMEAILHNTEHVTAASQNAYDFCIAHGGDDMLAHRIALAVEELPLHIMEKGFGEKTDETGRVIKKSTENVVELRLMYTGDGFTLCLRDDCKRFDLTDVLNGLPANDPMKLSRFALATGRAKEVQHTYVMNMNSLIVKF